MKHRIAAVDPHDPSQAGIHRRPATRGPRRIAGLAAALTLVLGGGLATALPATAAPTDPITMPDDALRACINAALGQADTDPITEAQADGIITVDCQSMGITDITGLETMPNLEKVWLNNNAGIASLEPIKNLTKLKNLGLNNAGVSEDDLPGLTTSPDLWFLGLANNDLEDISALADVTSLTTLHLHLSNNDIADVSSLSSLTSLAYLYLNGNQIADVSSLSSLTSLQYLRLDDQSLDLPSAPLGAATPNPVTDLAGDSVPVTSTDSGFSYDSAADTWSFSSTGNKSLTWDTPVTIGSAADVQFSGTISQRISDAQAVPEDPTVTQAVCMNGDVVYPQITLPDTEGIDYTIVGDVAPGETVTIEAVPADDDHAIYVDPASDWVDASGDHIYATLEITLDDPDCDAPAPTAIEAPNGDLPVDDPCGPDNATWVLPTGADVPVGFTWKVDADGLLTAEANDGYVFADTSGTLDPTVRDAPDTNETCPASSVTDGDDSDEVETTGQTLPSTGGPSAAAGILAVGLMSFGGLLIFAGRSRRQRA